MDESNCINCSIKSNLPGDVQTVPRAETFALLILLQHAVEGSVLHFYIDHQPLRNNFNKGYNHCKNTINADMYHKIFDEIDSKGLEVTVTWMPSHLDTDPNKVVPGGITSRHIEGNKKADELASEAASDFELPQHIVQPIEHYTELVKKIQLRLADIIMNLPPRAIGERPLKEPRPRLAPLQELFPGSKHEPFVNAINTRIECSRCKASVTIKGGNTAVRDWLATACVAISSAVDKPVPIPYDNMVIGRKAIHGSHKPYIYKGLVYCHTCGRHAGTGRQIQHLSAQCTTITPAGKLLKKAIEEDRLPSRMRCWPCDSI